MGVPLLVLAGAGSGKTRVLTHRVAALLREGVEPDSVLAVTFTNKAAQEMAERVESLVGDAAHRVWMSTFHSTCCRILRKEADALGYTRRFAIWDDDDARRLVRQIVKDMGLDGDRVVADDQLRRIDGMKCRLLTPDDALAQRRSHVGDPFLRVWRTYEETLRASDAMDFNDLIGRVVELFRQHPDVRQRWAERFRHVLVDEYQDTNAAQYAVLRLLTADHGNLMVVGDDDQSIYGFRGADIGNILSFQRDHAGAVVVRLEQNYRSTGHILMAANAVVAPNEGRLPKALWTAAPPGGRVQMVVAENPREEAEIVARMCLELRQDGLSWSDFAVIYRTNLMSRPVESAMARWRIPHRVIGGRKFWERREIRDVLAWLRLVANRSNDAAFLRAVGAPPRGVGPKTLQALRAEAGRAGVPLLQAARGATGSSAGERSLVGFAALVARFGEYARELPLDDLVRRVIEESGYRALVDDEEAGERQERLASLAALVHEAGTAAAAAKDPSRTAVLDSWLDSVALASDADEAAGAGEVSLMTVHSAKGLEFPVVFVVQLVEDAFPHVKSAESGIEEERRLAYVAFTRARRKLVLLRTRRGEGPVNCVPSRFLFGLPDAALVGDLPPGEPEAAAPKVRTLDEIRREMLRTMARRHGAARGADLTADAVEEVEDAAQLVPGTRVRHVRFGDGKVLGWVGSRLRVRFAGGRDRLVAGSQGLGLIRNG
jgi:DNA helicase-2/ATP-dependent DNA helicase PcrA